MFNKIKKRYSQGFTLVEMLVVLSIMSVIGASLVMSFSRSRVDITQAAALVAAQIRDIQVRTTSGLQYNNTTRCGYGITQADDRSLYIFVGPDANVVNCSTEDRRYNGADIVIETIQLQDPNVEFKLAATPKYFLDIFFEPPNPKTYLDNNASLGIVPVTILVGQKGVSCSASDKCRAICVYTSGKIETPVGITCPAT
jgi:prepilin-type N-terminal cleavage/methylation domain-containing protein